MARVEDRWIRKDKKRSAEYGKGKRWRAVWVEPDGTERKMSFTNKDAAKAHAATMEATLISGTYHSPNSGTMTVGEWAEVWYTAQVHQRDGSLETDPPAPGPQHHSHPREDPAEGPHPR